MATKVLVLTADAEAQSCVARVMLKLNLPQAECERTAFMGAWAVAESKDQVLLIVDQDLEGDENGSDFLDSPFAKGKMVIGISRKLSGPFNQLVAKEERDFIRLLSEAISQTFKR